MNRDAEIARLNHELEILRTRYALYQRLGRVLKVFFMICIPLVAALFVIGLAELFIYDAVMGFFFVGLAAVVSALIWLAPREAQDPRRRGKEWIDLASSPPWPIAAAFSPLIVPSFYSLVRNDAAAIEQQIAEWERRLKELEAAS